MKQSITTIIKGIPVDEGTSLTLTELCQACNVHAEYVIELVTEGALDPCGAGLSDWRFSSICLRRTRIAVTLQRDLRVNVAGVALALDLLDQLEELRS